MTAVMASIWTAFSSYRKRHRIRLSMRGYNKLRRSGRLDRVSNVKRALTELPLNLPPNVFSSFILGASSVEGELATRQYLLSRFGGLELNDALLRASAYSNAKVVYPLPSEWRAIIKANGFAVANLRCALFWQFYALAFWFLGVVRANKILLASREELRWDTEIGGAYAYFADLAPANLPFESQSGLGYNIVSWYLKWNGKRSDVKAIHHSVSICSCKTLENFQIVGRRSCLPGLSGGRERCLYFLWLMKAALIAGLDLFRGRWWHAILLNQAILSAQARIVPVEALASEYLFHNSSWIYRPLWTYDAQKLGSRILFYFYSTNSQTFNNMSKCMPAPYGWKAANWPRYLVWDQYQVDFLRAALGDSPDISVVGEIWFEDQQGGKLNVSERAVAVFDVQPFRDSKYRLFGLEYEYYVPDITNRFMQDVYAVVSELKLEMAFKKKRDIKSNAHPRYRYLLQALEAEPGIKFVSPTNSASRLIEECFAVISMPFTTTALIGHLQGKPSIYYDPNGSVLKGDCAAHGIEIVIGKDELRAWLLKTMAEKGISQSLSAICTEVRI